MDHFQEMFQQAVSLKNSQMLSKRQKFESLPIFFKAGLYYLPKFENVRRQNFNQKLYVCEMLKNSGNQLYKQGDFAKSAREYEQALSIFRFIENRNKNWKNEGIVDEDLTYVDDEGSTNQEKEIIKTLKRDLYLNLSISYFKNKEFLISKLASEEALRLDPSNVKALYRRAQSLTSDIRAGLPEYKIAIDDLERAQKLDPNDTIITNYLLKVRQDYLKIKNKDSQGFRGMYNRSSSAKNEGSEAIEQNKKGNTIQQACKQEPKEAKPSIKTEKNLQNQKIEHDMATSPSVSKEPEKGKVQEMAQEKNLQPTQGNQVALKEERKNDGKENPWEFFNIEKNYNDYNYELSYETNKEAQVPEEIKELGRFLETRGNEIVQLYERTGRMDQANELKEKLKKAMAAKKQLEKIATLDFSKPTSQLQGLAEKFGLDLQDQSVKTELEKIQAQNIQDIKAWLENIQGGSGEVVLADEKKSKKEDSSSNKQKKKPSSTSEGNKIYINNNFYAQSVNNNSQVINNFTTNNIYASAPTQEIPKSAKQSAATPNPTPQDDEMAKLTDYITNMNKNSKIEASQSNKVTNIMNIVIVAISIILFLATIFLHNFSS